MKFLHLGDLHLGKVVHQYSMLEDQRQLLDQVCACAESEHADAVIIAGDVYDRHLPPEEAVNLLDDFLTELTARGLEVFMIAGNHDSRMRLRFGSRLLSAKGLHIACDPQDALRPITMRDAWGELNVWMLPFIKPVYVRSFLDREIEGWQDAVSAMIAAMEIDQQARNVLIAHQFVAGAQTCDSEQAAMVGGVDQIAVSTFAAFDYVALGHLHSPQQVGRPHVRYSGSLMKYSFSEAAQHKQMVFADLREKGEIKLSFVPFQLPHDMRILRGTYDELAASGHEDAHREDYLRIILTDEEPVPDALARLRTVYPHIMELEYDNIRTSLQQQVESKVKERGAMELMAELYVLQNNQPLSDKQRDCLRALLEASEEGEA